MADHKTEKYHRINLFLDKGFIKLARAVVQKHVVNSTSPGHNPNSWHLEDFLFQNQQAIFRYPNGKPRHLLEGQKLLLIPPSPNKPNLEHWDITLLCFVLMELCPTSQNDKEDVKVIQKIRNVMCHTADASLSDREYADYSKAIKDVIRRFLMWLNDANITQEINDIIKDIEDGPLTHLQELLRQVEEWQNSERGLATAVNNLSLVTTTGFAEQDKKYDKLMEKMQTLIDQNGRNLQPPDTKIIMRVINCQNEDYLCEKLVDLWKSEIQTDDRPTEERPLKNAMSKLIKEEMEIISVKKECVAIVLRCRSFDSLHRLWTTCVNGEATKLFKPVEKYLRDLPGCENVELKVGVTEEELLRCVEIMETVDGHFPTLKELDALEEDGDICAVIEVLEDHHVPYEHLETFEELVGRLQQEYQRRNGISAKVLIGKAIVEAGDEDDKKRQRLVRMFQDLMGVVDVKDETRRSELIKSFLQIDGTTDSIVEDCEARISDLQNGECVILVAGETSAGKSSVLNLLFGELALPVFDGSCTSTITTVRYGQKRWARIIYQQDEVNHKPDEVIEDLDDKGRQRFNDIVFMKRNEREDGHNIMEIQLHLPVPFLKSGLVLADTPGIGENEFLENYLLQYIAKNQILGFMYIVMSDAQGGIQEDRLLLLLQMIIDEQKRNKRALMFDPKAAIFVCNRFDAIPEDGRDRVKQHILGKLRKFWPDFEDSSAVFMSARKSQRDVDAHPDYINNDFKTLLEAISKLFSVSMDRRIKSSYKWIERLLQRIVHYLKSTVKRLDMGERERKERSQNLKHKLEKLNTETNTVVHNLKADIEIHVRKICKDVRAYLHTPQAEFRLCSAWKEGEIPEITEKVKTAGHWNWVKERVDTAFYDRLCNLLEEWEHDESNISRIEEDVVSEVRSRLGLLEEEIVKVESDMRTGSSISSTESSSSNEFKRRFIISLNRGPAVDESGQLPFRLKARTKPLSIMDRFSTIKESTAFKRVSKAWSRKRSTKLLKKLIDERKPELEIMINCLLQRAIDYVNKVEQRVPGVIAGDMLVLNKMEEICLTERKHLAKYVAMMLAIENVRKDLMDYGEGYVFIQDFKSNEIKILADDHRGGSFASTCNHQQVSSMIANGSDDTHNAFPSLPRGLWSIICPGELHKDNEQRQISIKFHLRSSGVENTFQEVAKLRCLVHTDMPIAEFLGIHHCDGPTPAFVYSDTLISLQKYLAQSSRSSTTDKLLTEIACGIEYIHQKGLVHMELTTSTVTMNQQGDVRLTGACLPRRATLPLDTDVKVSEFVYLSPDVLKKDLYITASDVYGFGLLIYELIIQKKAFYPERKLTFKEYVEKVDPVAMLINAEIRSAMSNETLTLLEGCVSCERRCNMRNISEKLKQINGKFTENIRRSTCKNMN